MYWILRYKVQYTGRSVFQAARRALAVSFVPVPPVPRRWAFPTKQVHIGTYRPSPPAFAFSTGFIWCKWASVKCCPPPTCTAAFFAPSQHLCHTYLPFPVRSCRQPSRTCSHAQSCTAPVSPANRQRPTAESLCREYLLSDCLLPEVPRFSWTLTPLLRIAPRPSVFPLVHR
ncbi:hypothetical protein BD289DRAFT_214747 [Coniella lustricola]|uniref:Uncharacterized protein n=1 Tax=Coniella lustricola TaxID=2025994 RepID=A0A2T3ABF5_9PEZI|nr:hypothetical protein BD289DRAFT_214747 [Coniella lustricola]